MSKVYSFFGLNKSAKVVPIDLVEEAQSDSVLEYEVIPQLKQTRRKSFCSREHLESDSREYLERKGSMEYRRTSSERSLNNSSLYNSFSYSNKSLDKSIV